MPLNEKQLEAVHCTEGPLLILAGAGSGKTTVLVNRVSYILQQGLAEPWQVLAITFTNKAAGEIRERLGNTIKEGADEIWAYTFHSFSSRIMRRFADRLGYTKHFTIYDTDDQKRVMKRCLKDLKIDEGVLPPKFVLGRISAAKDSLIGPEEYEREAKGDFRLEKVALCYKEYQAELKKSDAMDFDDLIFNLVQLFDENSDVLQLYQRQFRYIMVDEFQDTSHAQCRMVELLGKGNNNVCVVGDDDQSIYKFRGATVENILTFEKKFPGTKLIRLEQNYRSTQNILDGANAVIAHNKYRKGKSLWTDAGRGEKIVLNTLRDQDAEAEFVAREIEKNVRNGYSYSDHAVLYRTNAQSAKLETTLNHHGIPHKVIGSHRFFDRKEIKDLVSFMALADNPGDTVRFQRVVNVPKRGIGQASVSAVLEISGVLEITPIEACERADEFQKTQRLAGKLKEFGRMMRHFEEVGEEATPDELLNEIIEKTGYMEYVEEEPETAVERQQNIGELVSMLVKYREDDEEFTLQDFLEDVALTADVDSYDETDDSAVLMTLHCAKGLEFPVVFICGMEEGVFPSEMSSGDEEEMEEERRLAYVGITRAKTKLYLLGTQYRMLYGSTKMNRRSRFIEELPAEVTEDITQKNTDSIFGNTYGGYGAYGGYGGKGGYNSYGNSFGRKQGAQKKSAAELFKENAAKRAGATGMPQRKEGPLNFNVGDTVKHARFGTGLILSKKEMGGDLLLEIAFDKVGTKNMMARCSNLEKV